ncbi:MAG TPA: MFS transporter [Burkholderiales bacterium]
MPVNRPTADPPGSWFRLFLPFAVGYYFSYLLRNVNAVIAPVLTRELDLSAADLGLLTSAYFVAFGAFQIPLGILLDRYGARRVEAALLLVAAAGNLVFAVGESIGTLAFGRALIGVGVSACLMAALKSFSLTYPAERQSSLTGAIMTSGGLGAISASIPLEALLPVLGWRGVFYGLSAVIAAAAVYVYVAVPERQDGVQRSSFGEQLRGVAHIFASRAFWRYAPMTLLFSGGFMAIQGLWIVPWFMNVDGLSREAAAQYLFAVGVMQLASHFAIAAFSTGLVRRGIQPATLIAVSLGVAWLALLASVIGLGHPLVGWLVYAFFSGPVTLMYVALGAHFAPQLFGRVSTAINLMAFAGAFGLQWGIGLAIDGFTAADWAAAPAYRAAIAIVAALQLLAWVWFAVEGRQSRRTGTAAAESAP